MQYSSKRAVLIAVAAVASLMPCAAKAQQADWQAQMRTDFDKFSTKYGALFERLDPNDYRHPYEKKIVTALMKDQKIKDLLPEANKICDEINQTYHKQHLLQGVLVSEKQYPEIYKMAQENAKALSMKPSFKIYVMNSAQMNAYTWSIDQNNYGIALFSSIINALSREELRYVLGHEMGHVKSKHILVAVLLELYKQKFGVLPAAFSKTPEGKDDSDAKRDRPQKETLCAGLKDLPEALSASIAKTVAHGAFKPMMVSATEESNMLLLGQADEYSGDRAGAVASGLEKDAMMGLAKLASGQVGNLGGFDLDSYLKQIETIMANLNRTDLSDLMNSEGNHAFTLMRVAEVGAFFKSPEYANARQMAGSSVVSEVMSAYYQVALILTDMVAQQKRFLEGPQYAEMNALERRLKEKEFADAIGPRQPASDEGDRMLQAGMATIGLSKANEVFNGMEQFIRVQKNGAPFVTLLDNTIAKIKFALQNPQPGDDKEELERKLKVSTQLKTLRPTGTTNNNNNNSSNPSPAPSPAPRID